MDPRDLQDIADTLNRMIGVQVPPPLQPYPELYVTDDRHIATGSVTVSPDHFAQLMTKDPYNKHQDRNQLTELPDGGWIVHNGGVCFVTRPDLPSGYVVGAIGENYEEYMAEQKRQEARAQRSQELTLRSLRILAGTLGPVLQPQERARVFTYTPAPYGGGQGYELRREIVTIICVNDPLKLQVLLEHLPTYYVQERNQLLAADLTHGIPERIDPYQQLISGYL